MTGSLPQNAAARKASPMAEGLLWYFPNALAAVAAVSKAGNDQHNPGEPMHHARGKSMDHADCIMRHLVDAGTVDTDGQRHSAKVAWRALALLQEELEREEGCPLPRNARLETVECGGCAPPVHASPRRLYDESGAIAAAQDDRLCADADTPAKSPIAGLPAESSCLASFSPNGSRLATEAEVSVLREHLTAEQLREYGIGDSFTDSHGNRITWRHVRDAEHSAAPAENVRHNAHPMAAEALRLADERTPEDRL